MAKTKVELQNYQGESLSPITIASNVLYEDGRNAQEVFEEYSNETFTPTIENSGSMFKVGQGDNVDYSSNVVNGAYESMVLKGKSMVNCIQESSSKDVVLPYEFADGQYVTINDTKESGALGVELKGQTLVNLISDITQIKSTATVELIEYSLSPMSFVAKYGNTVSNTSNNRIVIYTPFKERLKLNEDYTIVYDYELLENPDNVDCQIAIAVDMWGQMAESPVIQTKGSKGRVVHRRNRTSNNISTTFNFINNQGTNAKWKISNLMLLEGDWTNKEIPPYFEGMTSCKMPILSTKNNLFDGRLEIGGYNIGTGTVENQYATRIRCVDFIPINNPSNIVMEIINSERTDDIWIIQYDSDKNCLGRTYSFNIPRGVCKQELNLNNNCAFIKFYEVGVSSLDLGIRYIISDKSSILSLPEEVVLRSLPNGVCDTFNTRTGVYTQRIGEVVLDNNQTYLIPTGESFETIQRFKLALSKNIKTATSATNGIALCDKLKIEGTSLVDEERMFITTEDPSSVIYFNLLKTKATNLTELQSYLQSNPITVQYQLVEPIITKISLPSTLKSWNTTTHVYSEIPENTLYPILSHSNPSYPVILKPSTKYSIVANSYSNNHTNSTINFNLGGATASTTVGNRATTITTPSTLSNELLTMSGRGNKLNNVMVIEGDVVGDEPYFEGICDCKSPILSNVGKNLLPAELSRSFKHITGNQIVSSIDLTSFLNRGVQYVIKLAIPKYVKIAKHYSSDSADNESVLVSHGTINSNNTIARFTIPSNSNSYYLFVNEFGQPPSDYISDISELVTIELDTGNIPTAYEPYKSNTTTFNQKDGKTIVLRSLPNGVCDTLNVETGEYVQRIGEVVLDGSQSRNNNYNGVFDSVYRIGILHSEGEETVPENHVVGYCDKLNNIHDWEGDYEHFYVGKSVVMLYINKEKIGKLTDENIKAYLSQNPITVQYELATPIVTTIDVQGFPYAYTNGHVQLSSGSIEQSLTPKVEYSVATNRNGQIRTNQKMVEKHQQHLDQLQAMIISNMVNTQYQQTLTTLNYDLLKKEVGE